MGMADMALLASVAMAFLLAIGLLLTVRRVYVMEGRLARFEAEREALQARLDAVAGTVEQSGLDAAALRVSTLGLGAQLERLERAQGLLEAHLGHLERGGAQEPNYAQAIRQAARGHLGVEELVQDFGMPRGEAELLLRMHRLESEEDDLARRLNRQRGR